jgi:hypothetical protein
MRAKELEGGVLYIGKNPPAAPEQKCEYEANLMRETPYVAVI